MVEVDKMIDEVLSSEAASIVIPFNHPLDSASDFVHGLINKTARVWGGRM